MRAGCLGSRFEDVLVRLRASFYVACGLVLQGFKSGPCATGADNIWRGSVLRSPPSENTDMMFGFVFWGILGGSGGLSQYTVTPSSPSCNPS